ncbi:uncharacterized protein EDB91DRAFT_1078143 [Suillus paluster]|uniref:uncharacterized protein n=1 Tax=Suillus paluster TaxID=48578 RepID=UPI001B88027F|nr:uncharacterized protein EDB91DRAFT_1078143 [Suillus paluster]KAG1751334.1 hypothetical protein EDB91DRAFT_1078143 [Suillus paluster]
MSPVFVASGASILSSPFSLTLQVIPPALMLILPLVSTILLALSSPFSRNRLVPNILLALNAVLPAIAGGLGLAASQNHVQLLQRFWNVSRVLHACLLSVSSLYVLFVATTPVSVVPHRAFRFVLVFVTTFLVCETIAGSITTTPALLSPTFSLISRSLQLPLAVGVFFDIRSAMHQNTMAAPLTKTCEKHRAGPERTPRPSIFPNRSGRVSSPTPDTWPFPGSLAHPQPTYSHSSAKGTSAVVNLPPSLTLTHTHQEDSVTSEEATRGCCKEMRLAVIILVAQAAAVVCAALQIAVAIISDGFPSWVALQVRDSLTTSPYQPWRSSDITDASGLGIAHSVCLLVWAVGVINCLYLLPSVNQTLSTSHKLTEGSSVPKPLEFTNPRTPKPSLSRCMSSDSASDFLSMRDPFASPPPPPPPPPPTVGLGLFDSNRVQFGDVAAQYRFPAPKARKAKAGRKRRIGMRVRALEHQASAQTLLPLRPPPAYISEGERGLGDEVLLAQLLLQSLTAGTEVELSSPTRVTATSHLLTFPEPTAQIERLGSRWSASTAALSVSTSTAWSEKKSRASTSTSASARAAGRKSSEARKSTATGISASSVPST